MSARSHPLAQALRPLIEAIGGTVISLNEVKPGDITLDWEGEPAIGVRLADMVSLERLVATVEEQLGAPLAELDRASKQRAVLLLDERGAFRLRKSIEDIGEAMGVSRITIYNYLSALKNGG